MRPRTRLGNAAVVGVIVATFARGGCVAGSPFDFAMAGWGDPDDDGAAGDDDDDSFDCDGIPELPLPYDTIATIGSEDFAFDALGNAVIAERGGSNLYLQTYGGTPELTVANFGAMSSAGTAVMPGGDVVVADEMGPISRITPDGAVSVINSNVGANGLTVGIDGYVYGASYWGSPPGLFRVDPDSGDAEQLHQNTNPDSSGGYDGVTFAQNYESIYVNEGEWLADGQGYIYRLEFLQDGSVEVADSFVPLSDYTSGTLDGMTTDVCGNLYIAVSNLFGGGEDDCSGSGLFRYSPDGVTALVACFGNSAFTPSVEFGSGAGGWDHQHVYVIDWGGMLYDIDVGVPGKPEPW